MYAVYSFWSVPFIANRNKVHGIVDNSVLKYSWIISVNYAKRIFGKVKLVTDSYGYNLICNEFGLRNLFSEIDLSLNEIGHYRPELWATGKIKAYSMQTEPFIHIDYDAFIFSKLPNELLCKSIITESIEQYGKDYPHYTPIIEKIRRSGYNLEQSVSYAYNCGLFGGNDIEFIQYYCKKSFELIDYLDNNLDTVLSNPLHKRLIPIIYEQTLIAELTAKDESISTGFIVDYDVKYTHLKGGKDSPEIIDKLGLRMWREFPQYINKSINQFYL